MTEPKEPFRGFSRAGGAVSGHRGAALLDAAAVRAAREVGSAPSPASGQMPVLSTRAAEVLAAVQTPVTAAIPQVEQAPPTAPSAPTYTIPDLTVVPPLVSAPEVVPQAVARSAASALSAPSMESALDLDAVRVADEPARVTTAEADQSPAPHAPSIEVELSGDDAAPAFAQVLEAAEAPDAVALEPLEAAMEWDEPVSVDQGEQQLVGQPELEPVAQAIEDAVEEIAAPETGPVETASRETASDDDAIVETAATAPAAAAPTPARPASRKASAPEQSVSSFVEHFEAFAATASTPVAPPPAVVAPSQPSQAPAGPHSWTHAPAPSAAPQRPGPVSQPVPVQPAAAHPAPSPRPPVSQPVAAAMAAQPPAPASPSAQRRVEADAIVLEEPVLRSGGEIIRPRTMTAAPAAPAPTKPPAAESAADVTEELARAADPSTSGQELMALATHRKGSVRAAVATRADLPATVVIFLSRDHSIDVLSALLRNPKVPASTVRFLADHRDSRIADLAVQRLRNEFR